MRNRTVWKYTLRWTTEQRLLLPSGAMLLTAQMQDGALVLWALVNPDGNNPQGAVARQIEIHGTGHEIRGTDELRYLATVQDGNGLVWHVWERIL